jgi:hypothetical protein
MARNPVRARIRICLVAAALGAVAGAHPAPAYADPGPAARGLSAAGDNGVRAHCNGGRSCCKNHADSDPCPGPPVDRWLDPAALECLPA